ncbi:MAG: VCBS repeat-containing protein, partial [Propionibacteriaceae bacterium]|nr:VCBS repeat-containing protein [Propionibacteriaceae bacterium]
IGTASGTAYTLETADHPYAEDWTPLSSGTYIDEDVLGVLDTNDLSIGSHYLKLTVSDTVDLVDVGIFHFNDFGGQLHDGWPVLTGRTYSRESPIVFDLDGDGSQEIIRMAAGVYPDEMLHVWREDGTPYPGWPRLLDGTLHQDAAVGDVDNDGYGEIAAVSANYLSLFTHDGQMMPGWPQNLPSWLGPPALCDLDGDGDLEIVVPDQKETVYAWHHDGTSVSGWPVSGLSDDYIGSIAVADINRDGKWEVLVGTRSGAYTDTNRLYIIEPNGSLKQNWPQEVTGWLSSPSTVGDLDADGDLE